MKALLLRKGNSFPEVSDFPDPEIKAEGEVIINVSHAALNRRDFWICRGLYPGIKYPIILGSDLCGTYMGKEVVVNPGFNWGVNERAQGADFEILGLPHHGALAEWVVVPEDSIFPKPDHLSREEAAALPLAGVTAYRSLFIRAGLQKGERVLISGVGGGVATMALVMALANQSEVFVTSGSEEKIEQAVRLGARDGVNYNASDFEKDLKKITSGFDVIIDGAGGSGFSTLVNNLRPGGRIVFYGGTQGNIDELNPQLIFWRQLSILGSTMGSPEDFAQMLQFVESHQVRPQVDSVLTMDQAEDGFFRMESNQQFGKIVFSIS